MPRQSRVTTDGAWCTVALSEVSGTSWARAHRNARSSRARAPTTWWACFPRALHGLERVDDRGEPPGRHLVGEGVCQTRQPCGVVGDRADGCLAHERRCRGGTDDRAEPPEVGWTPGGPARRTESVPPENGGALALR